MLRQWVGTYVRVCACACARYFVRHTCARAQEEKRPQWNGLTGRGSLHHITDGEIKKIGVLQARGLGRSYSKAIRVVKWQSHDVHPVRRRHGGIALPVKLHEELRKAHSAFMSNVRLLSLSPSLSSLSLFSFLFRGCRPLIPSLFPLLSLSFSFVSRISARARTQLEPGIKRRYCTKAMENEVTKLEYHCRNGCLDLPCKDTITDVWKEVKPVEIDGKKIRQWQSKMNTSFLESRHGLLPISNMGRSAPELWDQRMGLTVGKWPSSFSLSLSLSVSLSSPARANQQVR